MTMLPSNVQNSVRKLLLERGEIAGADLPQAYADRFGQLLDYKKYGYKKFGEAMQSIPGVRAIPNQTRGGGTNMSFVLVAGGGGAHSGRSGADRSGGTARGGGGGAGAMVVRPKHARAGGAQAGSMGMWIAGEGGARQELRVDKTAPRPLLFSIAVDCSYSMQGERIAAACAGMQDIVQSALRDDDLYACAGFHTRVEQLHGPMSKARGAKVELDVRNLQQLCKEGGLTAMNDAVKAGIDGLKAAKADPRTAMQVAGGAKALNNAVCYQIIVTDGIDNSSSVSHEELCRLVAAPGLSNYHLIVIGVGVSASEQRGGGLPCTTLLEGLCAPAHATFQLAADCSALRTQLRWVREQIRATMTCQNRSGAKSTTTAFGITAVTDLVSAMGGGIVSALGSMAQPRMLAAPPAPPKCKAGKLKPKQTKPTPSKPRAGGGKKFCMNCGAKSSGQRFCGACGKKSGA